MKNKKFWFIATALTMIVMVILLTSIGRKSVRAQGDGPFGHRAPRCTIGTASGTYGYQMDGQILGVGPFLVNGLFTHYPNGTMDADVQLVVGAQSFPAAGTGGTFSIRDDCTGSGSFDVQALGLTVTYNFIATDRGNQIELLNTNDGVLLHGVGRRIAEPGQSPRCSNATILGLYGGRLEGSIPGVPSMNVAGLYTFSLDSNFNGVMTGTDTINLMGMFVPRIDNGTYKMESNCRGKGFYTDNIGNSVNFVMTAVDNGSTIYFMGTDPGVAVWGTGRRTR